jgi:calcineurin-like phosphoesterase|eukprot:2612867-Prymnesium_polylepis.1
MASGELVPFAGHDVAYKHLGRLTRPYAVDTTAWKGEASRKQKGLLASAIAKRCSLGCGR